ncbi:MAG TPA: hypothetical protein VGE52_16830, partial [Pirellulales bacterium]
RAAEPATANVTHEATPTQDLQSYLIRAFVESLAGMRATLLSATYSPRALEAALLGEFSPAAIAQRVLQAFRRRRRSTTAAAFQFVELLGVVAELNDAEAGQDPDAEPVLDVVRRTIDRLLTIMGEAAQRPEFAKTLREPPFPAYLRAVLPAELVSKVLTLAAAPTGSSTSPALVEDACDVAGS